MLRGVTLEPLSSATGLLSCWPNAVYKDHCQQKHPPNQTTTSRRAWGHLATLQAASTRH